MKSSTLDLPMRNSTCLPNLQEKNDQKTAVATPGYPVFSMLLPFFSYFGASYYCSNRLYRTSIQTCRNIQGYCLQR